MTTVTPKLYVDHSIGAQLPVWEINTPTGSRIFYERLNKPGYRPLGSLGSSIDRYGDMISVFESVKTARGETIQLCKEDDGYSAPLSWYERLDTLDQPTVEQLDTLEQQTGDFTIVSE